MTEGHAAGVQVPMDRAYRAPYYWFMHACLRLRVQGATLPCSVEFLDIYNIFEESQAGRAVAFHLKQRRGGISEEGVEGGHRCLRKRERELWEILQE